MFAALAPALLAAGQTPALPVPSNQAREGDFTALQIAFDDPERFDSEWRTDTPGANISTTHKGVRNRPIFAAVIFSNCTADAAGRCEVTADIVVTDPAGKIYAEHKGAEIWRAPAPQRDRLALGAARLGLRIEPGELLGGYRVRFTLHDRVAKRDLVTEDVLTIAEAPGTW